MFKVTYFNNRNNIGIQPKVLRMSSETVVQSCKLENRVLRNWYLSRYLHLNDRNIQLKNKFKLKRWYQLKYSQFLELVQTVVG